MAMRDYEITVRGVAGETVRAAFADMQVDVREDRTVFRGDLPDQAALHGLLDRARALGIEILEVRMVESKREVNGGVGK
jgi:hypothetical protein